MREQFEVLLFPAFVDGSENVQQLTLHRSVSGEWNATELMGQRVGGPVYGQIDETVSEPAISVVVDADMGVKLRGGSTGRSHTGSTVGDRVPPEPDW